jgi:hypothetical protein
MVSGTRAREITPRPPLYLVEILYLPTADLSFSSFRVSDVRAGAFHMNSFGGQTKDTQTETTCLSGSK